MRAFLASLLVSSSLCALASPARGDEATDEPDQPTELGHEQPSSGAGPTSSEEPRAPDSTRAGKLTPGPASSAREAPSPRPPDAVEPTSQEVEARAEYLRGDHLYLEGDYAGALGAFERAYNLSGRIEMLFNMANAHERLGNYAQASMALRSYIPHAHPDSRQALEKRAARCDELARAQKEALRASAPPPPPDKRSIPIARAVGFGLTGLGVVSLGVGAAFGAMALDQRGQLDALCESSEGGRLCTEQAAPVLEKDATFSAVADVAFVCGAVATIAGVYLIIDSRETGKELRVSATPGGLQLGGRF